MKHRRVWFTDKEELDRLTFWVEWAMDRCEEHESREIEILHGRLWTANAGAVYRLSSWAGSVVGIFRHNFRYARETGKPFKRFE